MEYFLLKAAISCDSNDAESFPSVLQLIVYFLVRLPTLLLRVHFVSSEKWHFYFKFNIFILNLQTLIENLISLKWIWDNPLLSSDYQW